MVGEFELIETLGQGGMGVVWRARHRITGELVALKMAWALVEGALDGLRREIRALAAIDHPGVVRLIADGVTGGQPWYAMELLDGASLRTLLEHAWSARFDTWPTAGLDRAEPLPPREPAAVPRRDLDQVQALLAPMIALCDALAHVHAAGLVHRDLTPDNVLLRSDGRPVLVDFGLAARVSRGEGRDPLGLDAGTAGTAGTAPYMAPEQICGELVDGRADLYALGCILHQIACGAPPFAGPHASGILSRHLFDEPIAPSRCNPEAPAWLDDIVRGLLAKDRRDRTGSAAEVAAALARGLNPGRRPDPDRSAASSGGSASAPCRDRGPRG
jgi:serine/threonine protein kinase